MKKTVLAVCIACLMAACLALAACGGGAPANLKDGTFTGQSAVYEDAEDGNGNGYGVATITVKDGAITACDFKTYETDGTLKDSNYGKTANGNQDFYNKAQKAVAACSEYADKLVAVGNVDGVDVISGATISYNEFVEAANLALDSAAE